MRVCCEILAQLGVKYGHTLPALRRSRFLTGEFDDAAGVHDFRWLDTTGRDLTPEQWADSSMHCFGLVIDGRARATGIRRPASDAMLLLVFSSHHDVVGFTCLKFRAVMTGVA